MTRIYGTEACPDGKRVKGQTEGNRVAEAAARLARELHRGQKDKGGNDYFESHLRTVGEWGNDWKERTAGYLHDAAEDTPHTVEEIVRTLQDECPGIAPEEWEEIAGTLHLMNSRTAPDRENLYRTFPGTPPRHPREAERPEAQHGPLAHPLPCGKGPGTGGTLPEGI